MKCMRASGGPPPIDHDDHKAQLGRRLQSQHSFEGFGDKEILWSGVDMLYHWIFFCRIKVRRPPDQAIKVSDAICRFALKWLGEFPAGALQPADISLFEAPD